MGMHDWWPTHFSKTVFLLHIWYSPINSIARTVVVRILLGINSLSSGDSLIWRMTRQGLKGTVLFKKGAFLMVLNFYKWILLPTSRHVFVCVSKVLVPCTLKRKERCHVGQFLFLFKPRTLRLYDYCELQKYIVIVCEKGALCPSKFTIGSVRQWLSSQQQ